MLARYATYAMPLVPILIFAVLLYLRRKHHLGHIRRKRDRQKIRQGPRDEIYNVT